MSRLIPARHDPPILAHVANTAADLELIEELTAFTDVGAQLTQGRIISAGSALTERELLLSGAYREVVNNTFIYASDGRFNTPARGAWYAADTLETAALEVRFHLLSFHLREQTESTTFLYTCYRANIDHTLYDTRHDPDYLAALHHDTENYRYGQSLADTLRSGHPNVPGVFYNSVRAADHSCVALFYPEQVHGVKVAEQVAFDWDLQTKTITPRVA